ncbi:helix-turn-helix domain-containing protein [Streptomyces sp. SID5998]|nr:helix-turn-helix domain-containing protein [Streptomyces sp. SID5998]
MAVRRPFALEEWEEIAVCRARGEGPREIGRRIGWSLSVVSPELRREFSQRSLPACTAVHRAAQRRSRPQERLLEAY